MAMDEAAGHIASITRTQRTNRKWDLTLNLKDYPLALHPKGPSPTRFFNCPQTIAEDQVFKNMGLWGDISHSKHNSVYTHTYMYTLILMCVHTHT